MFAPHCTMCLFLSVGGSLVIWTGMASSLKILNVSKENPSPSLHQRGQFLASHLPTCPLLTMYVHNIITLCFLLPLLPGPVLAFGPPKYKEWFKGWQEGYYVGELCTQQITTSWDNNGTDQWRCQLALDCIIGNTSGSAMQEMSSSLVLLGLTPTILSQLGPKLSESSMLSYQRPLLSFLLSMGAPTVNPGRIFSYDDPFTALKTAVAGQPLLRSPSHSNRLQQTVIIVLEYLFALGAICNIVFISVDLGFRSVLSWACTTNYTPLIWVLVPGFIHLLGAVAFHTIHKALKTPSSSPRTHPDGDHDQVDRFWHSFNEFTTCYGYAPRTIAAETPRLLPIILNNIAQALVVLHILVGTIIFSSCQFLRFMDAVPVIAKYATSSLVCRFINAYELRGMNARLAVDVVECGGESGGAVVVGVSHEEVSSSRESKSEWDVASTKIAA
jgi:hypothetical protein